MAVSRLALVRRSAIGEAGLRIRRSPSPVAPAPGQPRALEQRADRLDPGLVEHSRQHAAVHLDGGAVDHVDLPGRGRRPRRPPLPVRRRGGSSASRRKSLTSPTTSRRRKLRTASEAHEEAVTGTNGSTPDSQAPLPADASACASGGNGGGAPGFDSSSGSVAVSTSTTRSGGMTMTTTHRNRTPIAWRRSGRQAPPLEDPPQQPAPRARNGVPSAPPPKPRDRPPRRRQFERRPRANAERPPACCGSWTTSPRRKSPRRWSEVGLESRRGPRAQPPRAATASRASAHG